MADWSQLIAALGATAGGAQQGLNAYYTQKHQTQMDALAQQEAARQEANAALSRQLQGLQIQQGQQALEQAPEMGAARLEEARALAGERQAQTAERQRATEQATKAQAELDQPATPEEIEMARVETGQKDMKHLPPSISRGGLSKHREHMIELRKSESALESARIRAAAAEKAAQTKVAGKGDEVLIKAKKQASSSLEKELAGAQRALLQATGSSFDNFAAFENWQSENPEEANHLRMEPKIRKAEARVESIKERLAQINAATSIDELNKATGEQYQALKKPAGPRDLFQGMEDLLPGGANAGSK